VGGQLPGGLIAAKRMMKIPDVSVLGGTRNALPELSEIGGLQRHSPLNQSQQ